MKQRAIAEANRQEAIMRRRAKDLGYRMERHLHAPDRWYLVGGATHSLSIVASDLTLDDAAEYLYTHSALARP